jgi:hypothetical protein
VLHISLSLCLFRVSIYLAPGRVDHSVHGVGHGGGRRGGDAPSGGAAGLWERGETGVKIERHFVFIEPAGDGQGPGCRARASRSGIRSDSMYIMARAEGQEEAAAPCAAGPPPPNKERAVACARGARLDLARAPHSSCSPSLSSPSAVCTWRGAIAARVGRARLEACMACVRGGGVCVFTGASKKGRVRTGSASERRARRD